MVSWWMRLAHATGHSWDNPMIVTTLRILVFSFRTDFLLANRMYLSQRLRTGRMQLPFEIIVFSVSSDFLRFYFELDAP